MIVDPRQKCERLERRLRLVTKTSTNLRARVDELETALRDLHEAVLLDTLPPEKMEKALAQSEEVLRKTRVPG